MNSIILFGMPGGTEWILILLVVVLLFGGRKIPELMRGLGTGIREFNNAKNDVKDKIREGMNDEPKKDNEAK
ncbi:MAG: twin-arginine translocase TatA/TatE family subunit [Bacteroidetes bacterium]|nr:twin-arginine translocase TatA/TatE family subunit [Bacteroidota bacterium]